MPEVICGLCELYDGSGREAFCYVVGLGFRCRDCYERVAKPRAMSIMSVDDYLIQKAELELSAPSPAKSISQQITEEIDEYILAEMQRIYLDEQ